jgi:eukaryotic-like serine/threonine-protein kinase
MVPSPVYRKIQFPVVTGGWIQSSTEETSSLLHAWCEGDRAALDKLMPLVYDELHRLAHNAVESAATLSAALTGPGILAGMLKYMSPEELKGESPAESWDLWALAVVAYEMLTGVHPFAGSTSAEVRNAILDGKMTPLRTHLPEAPASWEHFFDKALAYDVNSRPQSALQLLSGFKQSI